MLHIKFLSLKGRISAHNARAFGLMEKKDFERQEAAFPGLSGLNYRLIFFMVCDISLHCFCPGDLEKTSG
jgi:hypothetical protein